MAVKYVFALGICLLLGCSPPIKDEASYLSWISRPKNGLVKEKQTAIFNFSLQYLPPAYRAWKEIQNQPAASAAQRDSIAKAMANSLYFIFTISLREEKASGDVLYSGVEDKTGFEERVHVLNFGMEYYWQLQTEQGAYAPVLTSFENTYSMVSYRKLHLVFAPPDSTIRFHDAPQWDLVFNDEVFGTGIHHFVFDKSDWDGAPEVGFGE